MATSRDPIIFKLHRYMHRPMPDPMTCPDDRRSLTRGHQRSPRSRKSPIFRCILCARVHISISRPFLNRFRSGFRHVSWPYISGYMLLTFRDPPVKSSGQARSWPWGIFEFPNKTAIYSHNADGISTCAQTSTRYMCLPDCTTKFAFEYR